MGSHARSRSMAEPPSANSHCFFKKFILAGSLQSCYITLKAPLSRAKLILQTQDANPQIISGQVPRYNGLKDCLRRTWAEQGVAGLYRGHLAHMTAVVPGTALAFVSNDLIKALLPAYDKNTQLGRILHVGVNLLAGGVAGALSLSVQYPLDCVLYRLAADVGSRRTGMLELLGRTVK